MTATSALAELAADRHTYNVNWEPGANGKQKLVFPPAPAPDDIAGHCAWITCCFNLDPALPVVSGHLEGLQGQDGHLVLRRAGKAPDLRIEPVGVISSAPAFVKELSWRLAPTDGEVYGYTSEHC